MSTSDTSDTPALHQDFYPGRRISYGGALCTVRYHGSLPGTRGAWLGVEWDDPSRGIHDGRYRGTRYFECLSTEPTAGSFIRPSRTPDPRRSFLDALRFKYAAEEPPGNEPTQGNHHSERTDDAIEISGKVVEEIGFEKIRKQQAVLQDLRVVLLDELCLSGITIDRRDDAAIVATQKVVSQTCPNINELDLGWNPIETWTDVAAIVLPLIKLQVLKISGLRIRGFDLPVEVEKKGPFQRIVELHLNENHLHPDQILTLLKSHTPDLPRFPSLRVLSLGQNSLYSFHHAFSTQTGPQLPTVTTLILDNNHFTSLASVLDAVTVFPNLRTLSLQSNKIDRIGLHIDFDSDTKPPCFPQLETINLSQNLVADYSFIDALLLLFPSLTSLRVSNNPFFSRTTSDAPVDSHTEVSHTTSTPQRLPGPGISRADAAYSLTLARVPKLSILNHSTITPRDREEGEIYYISLAERDLSTAITKLPSGTKDQDSTINDLKKKFPRYEELCRIYDRDSVFDTLLQRQEILTKQLNDSSALPSHAPGTLGARLIKARFYIPAAGAWQEFTRLLPPSNPVYTLKALLARHFSLPALQFRLIYESEELDPIHDSSYESSSWESWGDWDLDTPPKDGENGGEGRVGKSWKRREVEIVDGTKAWGDYVEDGVRSVDVRVEVLERRVENI